MVEAAEDADVGGSAGADRVVGCRWVSNNAVADKVGVNQATVVKWRKRYLAAGVGGLIDEPRPGAPRTITDGPSKRSWSAPWKTRRPTPRTGRRVTG